MEMLSQGYSQAGCRESSAKLAPREIAPHRKGVLPISIQSVYSFQIIVPVVQRIEQGFPKSKTSFLQKYAGLVSGEQIAVIKRLEYFLLSSRAISNLPIFTRSGDTTGDTKMLMLGRGTVDLVCASVSLYKPDAVEVIRAR